MCNCEMVNDLDQTISVQSDALWIYDSYQEFILDFDINFCPFCGENVQLERLSEKNPKEYSGKLPDHPRSLKSTQYRDG